MSYLITAHGEATPVRIGCFTTSELVAHLNEMADTGYDLDTITVESD